MSSNKYIKLAEKYMDNVARHYDPVPQEGAIIDFAIWLDKQAAQLRLHLTGGILPPSEPLSPPTTGTGIEYLSHQPTSK